MTHKRTDMFAKHLLTPSTGESGERYGMIENSFGDGSKIFKDHFSTGLTMLKKRLIWLPWVELNFPLASNLASLLRSWWSMPGARYRSASGGVLGGMACKTMGVWCKRIWGRLGYLLLYIQYDTTNQYIYIYYIYTIYIYTIYIYILYIYYIYILYIYALYIYTIYILYIYTLYIYYIYTHYIYTIYI